MMFAIRITCSTKQSEAGTHHLNICMYLSKFLFRESLVVGCAKGRRKKYNRIVAESFIYLSKCVVQNDFYFHLCASFTHTNPMSYMCKHFDTLICTVDVAKNNISFRVELELDVGQYR